MRANDSPAGTGISNWATQNRPLGPETGQYPRKRPPTEAALFLFVLDDDRQVLKLICQSHPTA